MMMLILIVLYTGKEKVSQNPIADLHLEFIEQNHMTILWRKWVKCIFKFLLFIVKGDKGKKGLGMGIG